MKLTIKPKKKKYTIFFYIISLLLGGVTVALFALSFFIFIPLG